MGLIIRNDGLGRTARDRLVEFSDRFAKAFAGMPQDVWAREISLFYPTQAPKVRFPLPISAAGYKEFKGEIKYRRLGQREITLVPRVWQDGVNGLADEIESADFVGFDTESQTMAYNATIAPNEWVRDVLEFNSGVGPLLDLYRDQESNTASTIPLFSNAHLFNVMDSTVGTFDNTGSNALLTGVGGFTVANVRKWATYFPTVKRPNGKFFGLQLTHVLCGADRYQEAVDFFKSDYIVRAIRNQANSDNVAAGSDQNVYKGVIVPILAPELTLANVVYPLALNQQGSGVLPIIYMSSETPETNILDRSSAMFEDKRMVGVNAFIKGSAGAALPHPIAKVTLS